ncbi:MAG: G-D-S-L family lipolytic protein [Desulfobacterales bacterium]|nr:G-D-S-L family lipolytic protein [Desulfobacterales bacterium]
MKSYKPLIIILCLSIVFSYLYGMMTVQYKFFPFDQLKAIKHFLNSSVNAKQIAKPNTNANQSHSDYFYHKKSFFDQHGGHEYDAVFIGDSITDEADWNELFPSLKIANRGIAGDRTDSVLKRMGSIYSTNAIKAFIMLGINDLVNGVEINKVVENYHSIIRKLVAHRMQVYVQSTILAGKQKAQLNTKIKALNEQLKKIADTNESVTYIDLNLILAKDSFLNVDYSRDGLHLNGTGYAVWKNMIENHLL